MFLYSSLQVVFIYQTGKERIKHVVQDAKLSFVIKAIQALAHAIHNMHVHLCGENTGICPEMSPINGGQLLDYLHNVSFFYHKENVFFDENGDPPSR